jgi:transposase
MARAYSNGLRRKLLEAYDRGEGSLRELAERFEAAGVTLLYLPPYSPDFNPIEKAWSKIKQHLRKAKARTLELLEPAVAEALQSVTSQDASGWFHHCGYAIH